jgi:hypothetical protein
MSKIEELNNHILEIEKINNERNTKSSEFLKNIVTIATGFLAIFISLKTKKSDNIIEHYLFLTMLSSIVLGILSALIVLRAEVTILNRVLTERKLLALKALKSEEALKFPELHFVKQPQKYLYIERFCYFSFVLSLVTLIIYSCIIDL